MDSMLRTFVAIAFPQDIKDSIAGLLNDCSGAGEKIRWIKSQNFHLTLKYLGPTPIQKVKEIADALRVAVRPERPFSITLEGVGGFPSLDRPRVIWVGVTEGADKLTALAVAVRRALKHFGFPTDERPFSPHATIGRVKYLYRPDRLNAALTPHLKAHFGQCPVKMLTWFKSTLTPQGPVYEALGHIFLGQ